MSTYFLEPTDMPTEVATFVDLGTTSSVPPSIITLPPLNDFINDSYNGDPLASICGATELAATELGSVVSWVSLSGWDLSIYTKTASDVGEHALDLTYTLTRYATTPGISYTTSLLVTLYSLEDPQQTVPETKYRIGDP